MTSLPLHSTPHALQCVQHPSRRIESTRDLIYQAGASTPDYSVGQFWEQDDQEQLHSQLLNAGCRERTAAQLAFGSPTLNRRYIFEGSISPERTPPRFSAAEFDALAVVLAAPAEAEQYSSDSMSSDDHVEDTRFAPGDPVDDFLSVCDSLASRRRGVTEDCMRMEEAYVRCNEEVRLLIADWRRRRRRRITFI